MPGELLYLVLTAVAVSIDSFFAGFSMSVAKDDGKLPLAVAAITFFLCMCAHLAASVLKSFADEKMLNVVGAIVLLAVGISNLAGRREGNFQNFAVGFAVGMDAAVANLSLAVMGYGIYVPFFMAIMHYFAVTVGCRAARGKIGKSKNADAISGGTLIILALFKLI